MTLTVGSLFSGIGGLDLGLERAGMNVIWQSEIDPYACRVLKKHWPEVPNHGDIKQINWGDVVRPDVVCGGYPCQPFSTAGKRKGENDPRHLWPWVREAISRLRPRYAILENVRGHLSLGGVTVIGELAAIGYDAEWRIVSAASVGANHRRDRIFIVAYPNNTGPHTTKINPTNTGQQTQCELGGCNTDVAYAVCKRCEKRNLSGITTQKGLFDRSSDAGNVANAQSGDGRRPEPHGISTVYGQATELGKQGWDSRSISSWWQVEPDVGRVADGVPNRVDRLTGLGNAVVPQVAEVIGRLVVQHAADN